MFAHCYRRERSETKTTNSMYGEFYAKMKGVKISVQPKLQKILHYIDSNREQFITNLAEIVKYKTITTELEYKSDVRKMRKIVEAWFKKLGMKSECFNIGSYTVDGKRVKLPPIVLGSLDQGPRKKTVCVYLHADVPKPDKSKWSTDPWTLSVEDNKFYGCGVACGKGPLISWLQVVEAFQKCNIEIPVNLKLVVEFMNHQHCTGLPDFITARMEDFLSRVDYVVVNESEWLGDKYVTLPNNDRKKRKTQKNCIKDDMKKIFDTIRDENDNVIIPGFHTLVEAVTPDEEAVYQAIDFDPDEIRGSLPDKKKDWDKMKLLMNFWRFPAIYVDDMQECICDKKDKSIVKQNFVLKIVPKQIVATTEECVSNHIKKTVKKLGIENKVSCDLTYSVRPWYEDFRCPSYEAATRATIQIYKECPNMIREDRSRETVTTLDRILEKTVLLLPLYCSGCNAGEENENVTSRNYYEGIKLLAAYLFQVSNV
ncbi:hypothetical protein NQ317_016588 [Molorchus minor]|uniref:Cytosolic non-specific dipeptidase n=1 Tax=Molorchus minor TaxID=1323400 RepID=A0ABQ9IZI0_9CUCU|nr:hypothetical protein NQ317_016588 [Molorchus minor]